MNKQTAINPPLPPGRRQGEGKTGPVERLAWAMEIKETEGLIFNPSI